MEEMKVIKEQTKEFGEITVVVIDGECYFLFSEINRVLQLEKLPEDWGIYYPSILYSFIVVEKSGRVEDVPGVGEEQMLIEMRAVCQARDLEENSTEWKKDGGEISEKEAEERIKMLHRFTWVVIELGRKHSYDGKREEEKEHIRKVMSEIIGEEI